MEFHEFDVNVTYGFDLPWTVVKDEKSPMNEKCPTCFEEVDAQASSSCSNCDTDLDFS